jgi:transposase
MLRVEQIEQIRQAYYREGKTIRQIAREQHHSRKVVAEALQDAVPRQYTLQQPRPSPVVGSVIPIIDQWLLDDQQRPKKQRHTAHRVWQRLHDEYQFPGAESTVRRYVREHRPVSDGARAQLAMIPLAYQPGQDAQADFFEAQVIMGGKLIVAHACAVRLCYSKLPFLMAFPHERQEAFLEGLARSLECFEAVPARISFDNPTTLVRRILEGHNREEQDAFVAFRSHYVFASYFCTPREGHEKGEVENLAGASRRNFFVPLPQVASFAELNAYLRACCEKQKARRLRGETKTIGELWQKEKALMRGLPQTTYPIGRLVPAIVSRSAQVTFETNRYSVPALYQKREVLIRASVWQIDVLADRGSTLIASHVRSYEREQDILDPRHYLGLLAQRPGALEHCKAIQQWERDGRWPTVFGQYLTALRRAHPGGSQAATREYVKILALYADPAGAALPEVLEQAQGLRCFSLEGVKLLLHQHGQPTSAPTPLALASQPRLALLARVNPPPPNLRLYDQLLGRRELLAATSAPGGES